jgi:hypothetical protein
VSARRLFAALATALAAAAAVAAPSAPPASVTPSGATLPENLLRIELHLRRPLSHPLAMAHVRLLSADGTPIPGALLDLPLPDGDGRTLTLLLGPARVKSGVGANLAMGRALRAGEDVALLVDDPQWAAPLRKRWRVVPAATQALDPAAWRFDAPRAGTRQPLVVRLAATLTASSTALIAVRGPGGERVGGTASLRDGETTWRFRPATAWNVGPHALVLHPRLEDVAGNRPCAPFEAPDLSERDCPGAERAFDVR